MERAQLARLLGAARRSPAPSSVIVDEAQPTAFMAALGGAAAEGGKVFVMDPSWQSAERAQFAALIRRPPRNQGPESPHGTGWLCLPTGGSSGVVRLVRHDQDTLAAAVQGCGRHFGVKQINAVGVLPLHHVSGLMAWIRCALTGGHYLPWSWSDMEGGRWPKIGKGEWFLSLVPTQLQRLLSQPRAAERLRRFRAILLGGGPAWPDLLESAASSHVPLAPGYGSTETAAMVTALRPEEFLAGRGGCGSALPHARVTINTRRVIQIAGASLFRGYYPHRRPAGRWLTQDLGRIDEQGSLHVLGRRDEVIISGGKKIDPGEVEAVLRALGEFSDVAVIGMPDAEWGEIVTACYPAGQTKPDLDRIMRLVARRLAPHKRPKSYLQLGAWPRNAQGKLNRQELAAQAGGSGITQRVV